MMAKLALISIRPVANLTGVLGSRPRAASRPHIQANTGASTMMATGFTDWK